MGTEKVQAYYDTTATALGCQDIDALLILQFTFNLKEISSGAAVAKLKRLLSNFIPSEDGKIVVNNESGEVQVSIIVYKKVK